MDIEPPFFGQNFEFKMMILPKLLLALNCIERQNGLEIFVKPSDVIK